jgi:electron transport complex protein RnfE
MEYRRSAYTPNPLLGSLVGLAPVIAVADSLARGLGLGAGIALSALLAGSMSHLLRESVPERIRPVLAYSLAGAFAAVYGIALEAWLPGLAASLGIFIPLVAVNGLVVHAVEKSLRKGSSELRGSALAIGGYFGSIILVATLRELLGTGGISLAWPGKGDLSLAVLPFAPLRFILTPAGAFILLGLLAAAWRVGLTAMGRLHR